MSWAMTQQLAKQHGLKRAKTKQRPSFHADQDRTLSHRSPLPPFAPAGAAEAEAEAGDEAAEAAGTVQLD